ncbi:TPA: hypothetical protein ACWXKW_003838, partial [Escherichia coli]
FACRESHFSAYLTLWFPLLIWWTPLCLIRQILTRRFRLYAYERSRDPRHSGRGGCQKKMKYKRRATGEEKVQKMAAG